MSGALDRIFAEISSFSKTMGALHTDFISLLKSFIDQFLKMTKDFTDQQRWKGWSIIGFSGISATCAVIGAALPKTGTPAGSNPAAQNPRLGANDGISDGISKAMKSVTDKFSDTEFLSSMCKTASEFSHSIGQSAASIWFDGTIGDIEAKRKLVQDVNLPDIQSNKSLHNQKVSQAHEVALSLIHAKSKGA